MRFDFRFRELHLQFRTINAVTRKQQDFELARFRFSTIELEATKLGSLALRTLGLQPDARSPPPSRSSPQIILHFHSFVVACINSVLVCYNDDI